MTYNERKLAIKYMMKFNKDQFFEINSAALMGMTPGQIAKFARPEFNDRVMAHIKYSIIDGMPDEWVDFMADPKFCYPQMISIKHAYDAHIPFEFVKENFKHETTYSDMNNIINEYIKNSDS